MRNKALATLGALAIAVVGLGVVAPSGAAADTDSTIRPIRPCATLVKDFAIPGAATRVTTATEVPAGEGGPAHCDVRGVIEPAVGFQLNLPTTTFTGRYLQYGCGGFCGLIFPPAFPDCGGAGKGGDAAVAATDDGHVGQPPPFEFLDGTWAANDRAARIDWFYRAPHVLSLAAKRIIAAYYGAPPKRSYFDGCSNGGREALLLAQRYPDDFDGIIAAAPANYLGPLVGVYETWLVRANTGANGAPILTAQKLPALQNAVLAACDRVDGLVDGQLDDPRECRFDPISAQCPAGTDQPTCLTPAQVGATRALYAGPTDEQGRRLYPGWQSKGSELAWLGWLIPDPAFGGAVSEALADGYLRNIGYPIGTPHSSFADFRFTVREFHRLTPEGRKANAMSLDLGKFRRSGGKLIIWHGWDDPAIPAVGTLDYYQRLWQSSVGSDPKKPGPTPTEGGQRETQDWARLFMVPTMYHCQGGYQLTEFNPFRELIGWVERGRAPERITATGRDAQGNVTRTRPVFPYPLKARYDGTGSIDDASNFVPVRPHQPPRDTIDWVGTYLHGVPGPVAS